MFEGCLGKFFFLLLRPAEIGSPEGKAVGDEDVEETDVEGEPPVVDHRGAHAALTLEENELHPGHHAGRREVENSHPPADLSQEAPTVDVVEQEEEED